MKNTTRQKEIRAELETCRRRRAIIQGPEPFAGWPVSKRQSRLLREFWAIEHREG